MKEAEFTREQLRERQRRRNVFWHFNDKVAAEEGEEAAEELRTRFAAYGRFHDCEKAIRRGEHVHIDNRERRECLSSMCPLDPG